MILMLKGLEKGLIFFQYHVFLTKKNFYQIQN